MTDENPRVLNDRYEIFRRLARGGMAEVLLARDRVLDRPVAVKELVPEFATDPNFVERFRREAQAAASLTHANVVGVYDWGSQDGTYFIVMEYVDGPSLSQVIRSDGPLHPRRAAEIAAEVADGLGFAHARGVVHRDIKPGNVLLTKSGQAKVTDFGIARALSSPAEDLTQAGSVIGTATYFSPEQAQGLSVDGRSDLYSLGVVLYEMLTGRPPFTGETPLAISYRHVQDAPEPPSTHISGLPRGLEAIIMKLLAKKPDDRYASAQDLRLDLNRFLAGETTLAEQGAPGAVSQATTVQPATTVATPVEPTEAYVEEDEEPKSRTGIYLGVLVALLVILGGTLTWFLLSDESVDKIAVPSVVGLTQTDAEKSLKDAGFQVSASTKVSDSLEAGLVLDQTPGKDEQAAKGSTVRIVVSSGAAKVEVPDVTGKTQAEAEKALTDLKLLPRVTTEENPDVESGTVIRQNPPSGRQIEAGGVVEIFVSKGAGEEIVPDVTGQPLAQAQAAIQAAGFRFANPTRAASSNVAEGSVISTDPAAGTPAKPNSVIKIVVSSGPEQVNVPTVTGQNENSATSTLKGAGLNVEVKPKSVPAGDPNAGRVISQDPAGGQSVDTGSTVTITVGVAAATTTTASTTTSTTTTSEP
ncbi:MAG: Stk1 family PASTA domain-containing Ser/Thr kinase [Microthrixaceae bacterium]